MKITRVESWQERLALSRPYTIAFQTVEAVTLFFVRLHTDVGVIGLGSASPAEGVTGETAAACASALSEAGPALLEGEDFRALGRLTRRLKTTLRATPAARAALDMALYDVLTHHLDVPLVDFLGRRREALLTSITIGIKPTDEALAEADEYLGRGFRCLKVKLGLDVEEDLERLGALRARVGTGVSIRVDANQGYSLEDTRRLLAAAPALGIAFIEQPMPAQAVDPMRLLPPDAAPGLAADESLHTEEDALALVAPPAPFGIFNIKLMKCGGITSALGIAGVAEASGLQLMWGCMDESRVSIAAALHAAYACPATHYLDLDGHLDLARDLASEGFTLRDGRLYLKDAPGLGVGDFGL